MEPNKVIQGQSYYVPYFQVKLGDKPAGREVINDIMQVTYKDNIEEIDSFEITINNWNADTRKFKYSDQKLFDPGHRLELWMGYYGQNDWVRMITGEITSLRPTFPASGQPTLAVSGLNLLHRLRKRQRSASYKDKTDSQIAKEIAQRLGVNVVPATNGQETPYDHLFQDNQYDIVFLMERARRIDYDLHVVETEEDTLFSARQLNSSV